MRDPQTEKVTRRHVSSLDLGNSLLRRGHHGLDKTDLNVVGLHESDRSWAELAGEVFVVGALARLVNIPQLFTSYSSNSLPPIPVTLYQSAQCIVSPSFTAVQNVFNRCISRNQTAALPTHLQVIPLLIPKSYCGL